MTRTKIVAWCLTAFSFIFFGCVFCFYALFFTKYQDIVQKTSKSYDLDSSLVFAVIKTESNFNKDAQSPAGAQGLMQLLPKTAKWLNDGNDVDLFEPQKNIEFGCKYLKLLLNQFEDKICALCAYNAGPTNVSNWLLDKNCSKDGKTLFFIPFKETEKYTQKVLNYEKIYQILLK